MILYTDISDHFPIVSSFTYNRENISHQQIVKKRTFPNTSIQRFVEELSETNWDDIIFTCTCANKGLELFEGKFRKMFEDNFPVKTFCPRNKDEICPYITPPLKKSFTEKKRLERLSVKWLLSFRAKYKTYRNRLTK